MTNVAVSVLVVCSTTQYRWSEGDGTGSVDHGSRSRPCAASIFRNTPW